MVTELRQSKESSRRSSLGGFTAGKPHHLSGWFLVAIRAMMGIAFRLSGAEKRLSGSFRVTVFFRTRRRRTEVPSQTCP
jgi:hypothetical protein